eukprot:TRINITY_DN12183_c0_g1_i3.p1 TRINITY_DN12183_c0_g1~~TRINITY_DN12183_c0_g1_i3.p1  ORF type:complete len:178 (-),score=22.27 TRINITY_DN12183_c0_g1_i3:524-1057(-)
MPIMGANSRLGVAPLRAVLAGGVAVGATSNLSDDPAIMVFIGLVAGIIATTGYVKGTIPTNIDTCGINNLYGMPSIFGGIVSIVHSEAFWVDQLCAVICTLVAACLAGIFTGVLLNCFDAPKKPFSDATFWDCAGDVFVGKQPPPPPPPKNPMFESGGGARPALSSVIAKRGKDCDP